MRLRLKPLPKKPVVRPTTQRTYKTFNSAMSPDRVAADDAFLTGARQRANVKASFAKGLPSALRGKATQGLIQSRINAVPDQQWKKVMGTKNPSPKKAMKAVHETLGTETTYMFSRTGRNKAGREIAREKAKGWDKAPYKPMPDRKMKQAKAARKWEKKQGF